MVLLLSGIPLPSPSIFAYQYPAGQVIGSSTCLTFPSSSLEINVALPDYNPSVGLLQIISTLQDISLLKCRQRASVLQIFAIYVIHYSRVSKS